jgi:hypothetical protein
MDTHFHKILSKWLQGRVSLYQNNDVHTVASLKAIMYTHLLPSGVGQLRNCLQGAGSV